MDARLRALQRRFEESGLPEDGEAWRWEILRHGGVPQERLEVAALAGSDLARSVSGLIGPLECCTNRPLDVFLWRLTCWGQDPALRALVALAWTMLEAYEAELAGETWPAELLACVEEWLVAPSEAVLARCYERHEAACAVDLSKGTQPAGWAMQVARSAGLYVARGMHSCSPHAWSTKEGLAQRCREAVLGELVAWGLGGDPVLDRVQRRGSSRGAG